MLTVCHGERRRAGDTNSPPEYSNSRLAAVMGRDRPACRVQFAVNGIPLMRAEASDVPGRGNLFFVAPRKMRRLRTCCSRYPGGFRSDVDWTGLRHAMRQQIPLFCDGIAALPSLPAGRRLRRALKTHPRVVRLVHPPQLRGKTSCHGRGRDLGSWCTLTNVARCKMRSLESYAR